MNIGVGRIPNFGGFLTVFKDQDTLLGHKYYEQFRLNIESKLKEERKYELFYITSQKSHGRLRGLPLIEMSSSR